MIPISPHDEPPDSALDARPRSEPYRLLIADDDRPLLETLAEICEVAFEVVTASCGREAVERIECGSVDVALFDNQMGELTGLEVVRIVRVEFALELPCLLMTARPDEAVRIEANRLGIADLLEKPFPRRRLVDSVATAMRQTYGVAEAAAWFDAERN